jgi:uncharacterized OB-fold protein
MAECFQCGESISPFAHTCPHCGEPDPCGAIEAAEAEEEASDARSKIWGVVVLIIVVIIAVMWLRSHTGG